MSHFFGKILTTIAYEAQQPDLRKSMPTLFRAHTPLAASAETMFRFHSDPRNLPVVMPPTIKVIELKTDGPAQEGRLIELYCRDWWVIPMRWTCRWKTVTPPHVLVDEIIKGPFVIFVHEHRFEAKSKNSCIMYDTVTYQWGRSWWGLFVSEVFVRLYLKLMFAYRHHRTRNWARQNS